MQALLWWVRMQGLSLAATVCPNGISACRLLQAHCYDEVEAFQHVAAGLVVNVGTLSPDWVASMQLAAETANSLKKPWVLDPVGAGATEFRTKVT